MIVAKNQIMGTTIVRVKKQVQNNQFKVAFEEVKNILNDMAENKEFHSQSKTIRVWDILTHVPQNKIEQLFIEILRNLKKNVIPDPQFVCFVMEQLGDFYFRSKNYKKAEKTYEKLLEKRKNMQEVELFVVNETVTMLKKIQTANSIWKRLRYFAKNCIFTSYW